MRARARLTVEAPTRLVGVVDAPPIGFRATAEAVYLVGTAAGPVGDDDVEIAVDVRAGAELRVRSAAATIAYRGTGTCHRIGVNLGERATLDWRPEPLIATAGCDHLHHARISMAGSARLNWTEEVLLGRHCEEPGRLDLRLDVDVDGRPLLRHQLIIGDRARGWDGPTVLAGARAVGLRLLAGPDLGAPPALPGAGGASDTAGSSGAGAGGSSDTAGSSGAGAGSDTAGGGSDPAGGGSDPAGGGSDHAGGSSDTAGGSDPAGGSGHAAWLALDGPGYLLTVVAADLPELRQLLDGADDR